MELRCSVGTIARPRNIFGRRFDSIRIAIMLARASSSPSVRDLRYTGPTFPTAFSCSGLPGGKQWGIIIGIYLAYRFASKAWQKVSPLLAARLDVSMARTRDVGMACAGNWQSPDPARSKSARLALTQQRKGARDRDRRWIDARSWIAIGVGIGFDLSPAILGGFGLLLSTVPASLTFGQ